MLSGCGFLRPEVPYEPLSARITAVEDGLLLPDCATADPRELVAEPIHAPAPFDPAAADLAPEPSPPGFEPEALPSALVPFTLDQALVMADQFNPRLQAVQARIEQARAGRTIAFADFLPQATAFHRQVAGTPRDEPYTLPTIPTAIGNVTFGGAADQFRMTELNLQWTLWDFGRRYGRYGRAKLGVEVAELQYARARQAVAYDVAAAYFGVLDARTRVRIGLESVRRAEYFLRDARNFKKRGVAIRNDVLRAQVLLADARLELVRARTAVGVGIARLSQVLGAPVPELPDEALPVETPLALSLPECLERAVAERDEFQVVLRAIESAQLEQGIAKADTLPRIFVGATAANLVRPDLDRHADLLAGGINIEWKFFDGGKHLGKMREARAGLEEAMASAAQVCDQIAYEVRVAYLEMADARERIRLSREAVEQSRENLRVVRSLLEEGDAHATDVVDAELARTRAEQNLATSLYDYQTALAKLAFALGISWDELAGNCADR
ncbi:MAG: TolC family protein [Gemmataceae bacterium]